MSEQPTKPPCFGLWGEKARECQACTVRRRCKSVLFKGGHQKVAALLLAALEDASRAQVVVTGKTRVEFLQNLMRRFDPVPPEELELVAFNDQKPTSPRLQRVPTATQKSGPGTMGWDWGKGSSQSSKDDDIPF